MTKDATDPSVLKNNMDTYCKDFLPRTDDLTVAIIGRAFENLGCKVESSSAGATLAPVEFPANDRKLVE